MIHDATDMAATTDVLPGRVVLVERLGGTSHVHVDVGARRLVAVVTNDALPSVGDAIALRARTDRVHVFAPDGRTLSTADR